MSRLYITFALICLSIFSMGCVHEDTAVVDTSVIPGDWLAHLEDGTVFYHTSSRNFICVDNSNAKLCREFVEVNQGLSPKAAKTIDALYVGTALGGTLVTAGAVLQDPIKKSRLDQALMALETVVDAKSQSAFNRYGKQYIEENNAVKILRDFCMASSGTVGHKVKDPAGQDHCCPLTTFVAAMGQGTLKSTEGFSASCCRAHEIWDGLGHCWDGNILPPGWTPPWKGDPMSPHQN